MSILSDMAENGLLPDRLIRFGIRRLDKKRLRQETYKPSEQHRRRLISDMHQSPIAIKTHKANEQHYEVPPAFFEQVLGRHLKYSGCYWPDGVENLDQAEERMLEITKGAVHLAMVPERRSTGLDRISDRFADRLGQRGTQIGCSAVIRNHGTCHPPWRKARPPQRLAGVDVSDAGYQTLVQQGSLQACRLALRC